MIPLAPIFKLAYVALALSLLLYSLALSSLTVPWLQRHVFYAHKLIPARFWNVNKPEQFGFARTQVTPFTFGTPDNETLYAWHILPLGLYAKHESEILKQPPGCVEDVTETKSFELLRDDPEAKLIISFHGNAGNVAQGWRTDTYRSLSDAGSTSIHILAVDYRGYGLSTGTPSEKGLIIDGIATVQWALQVAKVPANRIVLFGHSLGTAVTTAVAEHYAEKGTDFSGVILVSGFTDVPNLLTSYSIAGWVPILSPLGRTKKLQSLLKSYVVDEWQSAARLANFVRASKRLRLFIIHAIDDYEIPYTHSDALFEAATNATTDGGMQPALLQKLKTRSTIVTQGDGSSISTWKTGDDKFIREQILAQGGHNRIITYAPVAIAALKAFDQGGMMNL